MPIRPLLDFTQPHGGLWVHGGSDRQPPATFRRLQATERFPRKSLRARLGSSTVRTSTTAHSLIRYWGKRYAGVGTTFIRLSSGASLKTGLSGNRIHFGKASPTPGQLAYLYAASGSAPFKMDSVDTVTNWGIAAPADGFTATAAAEKTKQIDSFDTSGSWTASGVTISNDTTIKQEGTGSLKVVVPAATSGTVTKSITIDLSTQTGPQTSADEDFIACWVRVDNPENVESLTLTFSLNNTTFADNTFSYNIPVTYDTTGEDTLEITRSELGLAKVTNSPDAETSLVTPRDGVTSESTLLPLTRKEVYEMLRKLGKVSITTIHGAWTRLRIPKINFGRSGTGAYDWSDVQAVQFTFVTNDKGPANVYLDDLNLLGDVGLQGTYKYHITFYDSSTGIRSNPNPTPVEVGPVTRQRINLASLPGTCSDAQVDQVEIWRTVGDGTFFFKVAGVAIADTTAVDVTADAYFMDTRSGAAILSDTELPRTNTPPASTTSDVTAEPVDGVTWTLDSSTTGGVNSRAYYSAPGYPDGVAGYIVVSEPDDSLQRYAIWNGLYVFSKKGLFRIDGTYPIFTSQRVVGVPGTSYPDTVQVTPYGIVYCAADGPRIFDGARSERIAADAVGGLFEGDNNLENIAPITPTVAGYARDEYIVTNGTVSLGFNLKNGGVVRNLGVALLSMFYEEDTTEFMVGASGLTGLGDNVILFEVPATTEDITAPLAFEVQVAGRTSDSDSEAFVRRVYVDIASGDNTLTCTVILDGTSNAISYSITGASRTLHEIPIMKKGRVIEVRLTASAETVIEIFSIYLDAYIPGNDPP